MYLPLCHLSEVAGTGTEQHDTEQEVGQGGIKWLLGHLLPLPVTEVTLQQPISIQQAEKGSVLYLLEAAHEVVADWRPRQVSSAGASTHVEEVVRAQHSVVFLRVTCGGQDSIH